MKQLMTILALVLAALLVSPPASAQQSPGNAQAVVFQPTAVANTSVIASNDQANGSWRGAMFAVAVSNFVSGTVTVTVQAKDPVSGNYVTLLASAALAANGTTLLTIYPGIAVSANVSANTVLPATWRVTLTGASSPSMTVSVSATLEE